MPIVKSLFCLTIVKDEVNEIYRREVGGRKDDTRGCRKKLKTIKKEKQKKKRNKQELMNIQIYKRLCKNR